MAGEGAAEMRDLNGSVVARDDKKAIGAMRPECDAWLEKLKAKEEA